MIGHKSIEDFIWLSKIRINSYLWSVVAPSVGKSCFFSGPTYYFTFLTFCFCFLHNCGSCIGNVIHFLVNLCGSMLNERGLTVASISEKEWSCARFTLIPTGWSRLIGWRILHKVFSRGSCQVVIWFPFAAPQTVLGLYFKWFSNYH